MGVAVVVEEEVVGWLRKWRYWYWSGSDGGGGGGVAVLVVMIGVVTF